MKKSKLKISLKNKKIAIQLMKARKNANKTVQDCALFLNISIARYDAFEAGELSPSLPELEILSYFFNIPLKTFFESKINSEDSITTEKVVGVIKLRTKIIATRLLNARNEQELSIEEVSKKTNISSALLKSYETGEIKIPYSEFETLSKLYNLNMQDFMSTNNILGQKNSDKESFEKFLLLPEDIRNFINKPINQPYLELAIKLSNTDVAKLRSLAENLLEITF